MYHPVSITASTASSKPIQFETGIEADESISDQYDSILLEITWVESND